MIANSENQLSGGSAAEASNINSNQATTPNQKMPKQPDEIDPGEKPVQLKQAGAKFECAASSLKYNIKHGKLPAYQENAMAPYMVRLSDVERFLRETPGVASMFYPKSNPPGEIKDGPSLTGLIDEREDQSPPSSPDTSGKSEMPPVGAKEIETNPPAVQTPADGVVAGAKREHKALDGKQITADADGQANPSTQAPPDGIKRRRRRRRGRGKGGVGNLVPSAEPQPLFLKALAGTTPKERLRLTACLNELAGLVASA